MKVSITEMVATGRRVIFTHYKNNQLWYVTEIGQFCFPVPLEDIGNTECFANDKAIIYLSFIKKHMEMLEAARERQYGE